MATQDISQEIQEDVLSCPICNHQLTEPKALPCQHTYCCKCLQELAKRTDRRRFPCPECRKMVSIPSQGVEAFPTNFLVANVLEKVQHHKEEKKKQADEMDMCIFHKQEAQVVCITCNFIVCSDCLKAGHKEHVLKHIDQEKAFKLEELKRLLKKAKDMSTGLVPVKQRLNQRHNEVRRQIESRAADVIDKVQRQKKSLLKELDKRKARKLAKINREDRKFNALLFKETITLASQRAEEAINSNKKVLYEDISHHHSCLTTEISDGAEYHAKRGPLLEEVGGLKFEQSNVEEQLLGHIVEGSDDPSGSKSSSSGSSLKYLTEEDTKKGKERPVVRLKKSEPPPMKIRLSPIPFIRDNQASASASASTSRSSSSSANVAKPSSSGIPVRAGQSNNSKKARYVYSSDEDDDEVLDILENQPVRVKKSIVSFNRGKQASASTSTSTSRSSSTQIVRSGSSVVSAMDEDDWSTCSSEEEDGDDLFNRCIPISKFESHVLREDSQIRKKLQPVRVKTARKGKQASASTSSSASPSRSSSSSVRQPDAARSDSSAPTKRKMKPVERTKRSRREDMHQLSELEEDGLPDIDIDEEPLEDIFFSSDIIAWNS
uniref:RING-type domain-containing protein n=1 Tax=Branchiostoma floridae TaxID=7739 RepID=C3YDN2_BRAFL|eukprot:XP_002605491.1 hypothetical protein BRAFLDRAFT_92912 [Branchiostoma floridae]